MLQLSEASMSDNIIFRCPKDGELGNEIVDVLIPSICPTCGFKLVKKDIQINFFEDLFEATCQHFYYYSQIWNNRIIEKPKPVAKYGINCRCCNEYFPHAEVVDNFKCWSCKTYLPYI